MLISVALGNCGICDRCNNKLNSRSDVCPKVRDKTTIVAGFFPGFSEDLTGWETSIDSSGTVTQRIDWYGPAHDGRRPETRFEKVSSSAVQAIERSISKIDRLGVARLNQHFCIDDAELVYIVARDIGFQTTMSPYTFAFLAAREQLPDRAADALAQFQAAWHEIEAISPYSTQQHWKKGNKEVNPGGGSGGF
ncbi:MAG: hypothetical protein U1D30_05535 [Planctomycetota bacterium]